MKPAPKDPYEREFPARPDQLGPVRDAVRSQARARGCSHECASDVALAVTEACQNIIRHAYRWDPQGTIRLELERRGDELLVSLFDDAPLVDPEKVQPRDLDDMRPGGLGTHLIRTLMDHTELGPGPGGRGNHLRMIKRIE